MTSTPIKEVKTFYMGNGSNTSKSLEVQNTENFSKVFDKTQKPAENTFVDVITKKAKDQDCIQNHAKLQKNNKSDNFKEKTEEVADVEDMEEAAEKAAGMMVEEIARSFDVTTEEVKAVLEELGLTELDLLNSENLTKVVLGLNPNTDAFTLMTNEELFGDLKNLMNMAQDLTNQMREQFNLSEEDMKNLLQSMKEQMRVVDVVEDAATDVNSDGTQLSGIITELSQDTLSVEAEVKSEVDPFDESAESYKGTVIPKTEVAESSDKGNSESRNDFGQNAGQSFNQQFINQLADAVEQASGTNSAYGVNGQEILRQITDYIRLHVNTETTEMELQLHPASLGNIKVQLVSTEGVLSAIFTTENETVKAALEAQLIQLKDNFAQQGLKVESVEVNVSAQGFERSLDQQEQQGRNQYENSGSKKGSRRLRLDGMAGSEAISAEDMAEEDRIVVDMMLRNGNSVDYTV